MMPTGPSMLMMLTANRGRPMTRPSREVHQYDESAINSLSGPGVYWDTNVLIRRKGGSGNNSSISQQKRTKSVARDGEGQEGSNTLTDRDAEFSVAHDNREDSAPESNKHYLETGEEDISAYSNSFFRKKLDIYGKELTPQEDISLQNDRYQSYDTNSTSTSTDPDYTKFYQGNNYYESNGGGWSGWDYYDEYDSTLYAPSQLTVEPSDGGNVRDKHEFDLYDITKLRNYGWAIATSVYKQLSSSLSVVQCSELVVCEANRIGRAWGDSGMLLASGLR
jgi:hypothetical protein